ncbi:sigma factor-like helix-turn-helix DNA-binding protein [Lysinibacillus sp. FW12]|uniref:sigma factor-like helix-turn-helix DNA-binding protein n=1 Tax=Lysinibacillus sp. FW12 TaxID=3096079 RepID=UPI003D73B1D4
MKQNAREVDKLVEEYLKIYPYISKEKVGDLTKNQKIAICISDLLSIMPEKEVNFINFRYIKGWTIVKIAQEMNYSQQMIYVVRKKALKKIYHGINHLLKEKS